jgi:hypothetical protein
MRPSTPKEVLENIITALQPDRAIYSIQHDHFEPNWATAPDYEEMLTGCQLLTDASRYLGVKSTKFLKLLTFAKFAALRKHTGMSIRKMCEVRTFWRQSKSTYLRHRKEALAACAEVSKHLNMERRAASAKKRNL